MFRSLLPLAALLLALISPSAAHGKCRTHRCWHRVSLKRHRDFPKRHPERYRHWRTALASWYGPGLYGNGMACGGTLTEGSMIVANKTMACGTRLTICYRGCARVTVMDRGPYVAGREFDLAGAVASAVGFGGVGTVRWSR